MSSAGNRTALSIIRRYYPEVEKVVDAQRGTKITVTEKDCENGVGKAPNICAIAKAAMRHYDGAIVSLSRAYLIKGKVAYRYAVPGYVTRELISFDRAHVFDPGVYTLDKLSPAQRMGVSHKPPPVKKKAKYPRSKKRRHYTGGIRALAR
jgi:hypothetical protein